MLFVNRRSNLCSWLRLVHLFRHCLPKVSEDCLFQSSLRYLYLPIRLPFLPKLRSLSDFVQLCRDCCKQQVIFANSANYALRSSERLDKFPKLKDLCIREVSRPQRGGSSTRDDEGDNEEGVEDENIEAEEDNDENVAVNDTEEDDDRGDGE
jgi:hypothetical protein